MKTSGSAEGWGAWPAWGLSVDSAWVGGEGILVHRLEGTSSCVPRVILGRVAGVLVRSARAIAEVNICWEVGSLDGVRSRGSGFQEEVTSARFSSTGAPVLPPQQGSVAGYGLWASGPSVRHQVWG